MKIKISPQIIVFIALLVFSQVVFFSYATGNLYTLTNQTSVLGPVSNTPNYWNNRSQAVADYLVKNAWNPTLGLLTDPEFGCTDYVDKLPCHTNAWTTSDNVPTCWTLGDFGYPSQMQNCESSAASLGAFSYNNGMRYEPYTGNPIVQGNPQDTHTILQPVNGTNHISCPNPPCYKIPSTNTSYTYGSMGDGTPYGIECDCWNGQGVGTPNPNAGVDIAAPQAIDAWLFGNLNLFTTIENNLVARYTSSNYLGTGSTWQLGQVMFVMRIGGQDNTTAFINMANMLWSLQNKAGYLPNTYSGFGHAGSGRDAENQDAGLLPYSTSVITLVKNSFGVYSVSGSTQTVTKTITNTKTIALTTVTKTAITTTVRKIMTSTATDTSCCVTSTKTTTIPTTTVYTSTCNCYIISTFTLTSVASSTTVIPVTTIISKTSTNTVDTTTTFSNTYTFNTTITAYSILETTIKYSTTITSSATTTLYSIIPTTLSFSTTSTVLATSTPTITCTDYGNGTTTC